LGDLWGGEGVGADSGRCASEEIVETVVGLVGPVMMAGLAAGPSKPIRPKA